MWRALLSACRLAHNVGPRRVARASSRPSSAVRAAAGARASARAADGDGTASNTTAAAAAVKAAGTTLPTPPTVPYHPPPRVPTVDARYLLRFSAPASGSRLPLPRDRVLLRGVYLLPPSIHRRYPVVIVVIFVHRRRRRRRLANAASLLLGRTRRVRKLYRTKSNTLAASLQND